MWTFTDGDEDIKAEKAKAKKNKIKGMTNHYVTTTTFRPMLDLHYKLTSFFVTNVDEMTAMDIYLYLRDESIKNFQSKYQERLDQFKNFVASRPLEELLTVEITLLKSEP